MRQIEGIVIHCADTPPSMDIGVEEITRWHTDPKPKGNGWSRLGYHWIIRRDGAVEKGIEESDAGIHARDHNADSIGICMVGGKGECNFTRWQWAALEAKLMELKGRYPDAEVCGHRDLDQSKQCPQFNVAAWWANHD